MTNNYRNFSINTNREAAAINKQRDSAMTEINKQKEFRRKELKRIRFEKELEAIKNDEWGE